MFFILSNLTTRQTSSYSYLLIAIKASQEYWTDSWSDESSLSAIGRDLSNYSCSYRPSIIRTFSSSRPGPAGGSSRIVASFSLVGSEMASEIVLFLNLLVKPAELWNGLDRYGFFCGGFYRWPFPVRRFWICWGFSRLGAVLGLE